MAGTKDGGRKAAETNKKRYGDDFYTVISRKGGQACVPKGFACMPREKVIAAGQKGGAASRRGSLDY